MSVKSLLRWSGVATILVTTAGGCSVYDKSLVGSTRQCEPGTVGCVPSRPAASTSDTADAMETSFALRDVLLNQYNDLLNIDDPAQPWRTIGFDIDAVQTTSDSAPTSCLTIPQDAGFQSSFPVDGQNGIDNAFGSQLVPNFVVGSAGTPGAAPNLQNDVCCFHQRGRGTMILRVTQWNGQRDDAQVTVALMISADATSANPTTTPVEWVPGVNQQQLVLQGSSTPAPEPAWTPDTDTFYVSTREISGGDLDGAKHADTNAYIRDGNLVMQLNPSQPVKLYLGATQGIAIGLQGGQLVAHMSEDGRFIDVGTLGGRMGQAELKDASIRLLGSGADQGVCNGIVDAMKALIDTYGDVLANGAVNPDAPCDAMSVGVKFRGVRARALDVAGGYVCFPYPDCDGNLETCDATVDDATCPFGSAVCTIPGWTGN